MLEMTIRDIIPAVSRYVGELSERVNAKLALSKSINVTAPEGSKGNYCHGRCTALKFRQHYRCTNEIYDVICKRSK